MEVTQLDLFPDFGIKDDERLYVIGNGFDVHHGIESKYSDFKEWIEENGYTRLVGLMDTFFSNECDFWADIENALGDYREKEITDFCEPENSDDFKYDHPGQWQAGIEDSIPYVFGEVMNDFKDVFIEWVNSIDISEIEVDLKLPSSSKFLSFNYTETLENNYYIPEKNVLHIHGNRLKKGDELVIGHGNHRDINAPYGDDEILYPYQNAYSEVIEIMNHWVKATDSIIFQNRLFFQSLHNCKAVYIMGLSYSDIDMPYLRQVLVSVNPDCLWLFYYYTPKDYQRANETAIELGLKNYRIKRFE